MSLELRTIKGDTLGELVKCKSSRNSFQFNLPEKIDIRSLDRILERFVGHVRPWTRTCLGPSVFSSVLRTYLSLLPDSSKFYQICPVIPFFTVTKSFCRTYPISYPGYSNLFWTYPVPELDISTFLELTQVKPSTRHIRYPGWIIVTLCRHVWLPARTCPDLRHPNGRIPFGAYKRSPTPPSLRWPLYYFENTLNQPFLSSKPLPF
jgi:hypothetical protein